MRLFAFLLTILVVLGFIIAGGKASYQEISAEELVQMQKEIANLKIIDSRSEEQVRSGMIKGAINLPVYDTDEEHLLAITSDKNTPIVFYCNNKACGASAIAASHAHKEGYKNLYKYSGGIEEWQTKGLAVSIAK